MIRSLTAYVLAGLMAIGAVQPAQAILLRYDFTFFANTFNGNPNTGITGSGGGFFTIASEPTVDLGDLADFFFVWTLAGEARPPNPNGSFVYRLLDVASFSATVSGNSLTSLALQTRAVPQANGDEFNPQF